MKESNIFYVLKRLINKIYYFLFITPTELECFECHHFEKCMKEHFDTCYGFEEVD